MAKNNNKSIKSKKKIKGLSDEELIKKYGNEKVDLGIVLKPYPQKKKKKN